jgi:hypothetical protein
MAPGAIGTTSSARLQEEPNALAQMGLCHHLYRRLYRGIHSEEVQVKMLDYVLGQETFNESAEPLTIASLFGAQLPRLENRAERLTNRQVRQRIRLMRKRFEQGRDLHTGKPLTGLDRRQWQKILNCY